MAQQARIALNDSALEPIGPYKLKENAMHLPLVGPEPVLANQLRGFMLELNDMFFLNEKGVLAFLAVPWEGGVSSAWP